METTVVKRSKRVRDQGKVIDFSGVIIFLPIAIAVIDLSVFMAVFMGIIGCLYLFSFIRSICITEIPAEIIISEGEFFFKSVGTFRWDEIDSVEVCYKKSSNEFDESKSTYLHILLENRKSLSFRIDLLEKNAAEIMALFQKFLPSISDYYI